MINKFQKLQEPSASGMVSLNTYYCIENGSVGQSIPMAMTKTEAKQLMLRNLGDLAFGKKT